MVITVKAHDSLSQLKLLYRALSSLDSAEAVERFMKDLCTPAELQAMADRWQVVPLLEQGESYRQIYEKTGVSVTTVGRIARTINFGAGGYRLALNSITKRGR